MLTRSWGIFLPSVVQLRVSVITSNCTFPLQRLATVRQTPETQMESPRSILASASSESETVRRACRCRRFGGGEDDAESLYESGEHDVSLGGWECVVCKSETRNLFGGNPGKFPAVPSGFAWVGCAGVL